MVPCLFGCGYLQAQPADLGALGPDQGLGALALLARPHARSSDLHFEPSSTWVHVSQCTCCPLACQLITGHTQGMKEGSRNKLYMHHVRTSAPKQSSTVVAGLEPHTPLHRIHACSTMMGPFCATAHQPQQHRVTRHKQNTSLHARLQRLACSRSKPCRPPWGPGRTIQA